MKLRVKSLLVSFATVGLAAGLMVALAPSGTAAPVYSTSCHGIPYYDRGYLKAHPDYAANGPTTPCVADDYSMYTTGPIPVTIGLGNLLATTAVNVTALHGVTDVVSTPGATSASANSTAAAVALKLPGLTLLAHGLYSQTSATMSGGLCNDEVTTGQSSIGDLTINGKAIEIGKAPITLKIGAGLINIYANQTVRSGNTITQRALYIEPFGAANGIAVAESESGVSC